MYCTPFCTFNHFLPASVQFRRQEKQREQSVVKYQNIPFIQNQSQAQTSNISYNILFQTKKNTKMIIEPWNKAL